MHHLLSLPVSQLSLTYLRGRGAHSLEAGLIPFPYTLSWVKWPRDHAEGQYGRGVQERQCHERGAVWVPDSPCLPTLTSLSCEFLYHLAMTIAPTSQGRFGEFYFINMCKALGMVAGGLCSERPVLGFVFCLIIFEHGAPHTPVALGCVNPVASPGKSPVCVNTYNLAQSS